MNQIEALIEMRASALDALLTLHQKMSTQKFDTYTWQRVEAWATIHKAALAELQLLAEVGVIASYHLDPAYAEKIKP